MKADFSRSSFDPSRQFKRVSLQQGRVQTDADANEQLDIVFYRAETEAADLIGGCGGPIHDAGFALVLDGGDLRVGMGRYYVDGLLVENRAEATYREQPFLPLSDAVREALGLGDALVDPGTGRYLVYLDVWEWHRTALEVPGIREVALGGPDTATRTQVVWQVKLHALPDDSETEEDLFNCAGPVPSWDALIAPSTGQLRASTNTADRSSDPCIVPPGAGYRRLENQLYRVEVHAGGSRRDASFKWDRDNGTILARLLEQSPDGTRWTLSSPGRDAVLRFAPGDWAEVTNDARELHGLPGSLVQVISVEGSAITVDPSTMIAATGTFDLGSIDPEDATLAPKVRRWNGVFSGSSSVEPLEDGVQVELRGDSRTLSRTYRTGDYWTIPARTNTGTIEWTKKNDGWAPAEGIRHRYCRLGLVTRGDGWEPERLSDCRWLFPPVTGLTRLSYVGGDGQEGVPGETLDIPLQVGVANGSYPVEGATVEFRVLSGGGSIGAASPTDADGLTSVRWRLGNEAHQQVEAVLLDAAGDAVHLPIQFSAQTEDLVLDYVGGDGQHGAAGEALSYPLQVGVSRGSAPVAGERVRFRILTEGGGRLNGQPREVVVPTTRDGTASVEWTLGTGDQHRAEAVLLGPDSRSTVHLPVRFAAQIGGPAEADPGFHVMEVNWKTGAVLRNDGLADYSDVGSGLVFGFDAEIAAEAIEGGPGDASEFPIAKPVCTLTVHLPYPLDEAERSLWDLSPFGTRPIRLDGRIEALENRLLWQPASIVREWLKRNPVAGLREMEVADRLLCSVTLKGDKIWTPGEEKHRVYLDGEAFGIPRSSDQGTDVVLPTGDGRRGSDLEMWFWLVEERERTGPRIATDPAVARFPGFIRWGETAESPLVIRNTGDETLSIERFKTEPDVFAVKDERRFPLDPGESRQVTVTFTSNGDQFDGELFIESNATNDPGLRVPLSAEASGGESRFQFIHGVPDGGPVRLLLDDAKVPNSEGAGRPFAFRSSSPLVPVQAGTRRLLVIDVNGNEVFDGALDVPSGTDLIAVLTRRETGELNLILDVQERLVVSEDRVRTRVINGLSVTRDLELAERFRRADREILARRLRAGSGAPPSSLDARDTRLALRVDEAEVERRVELSRRGGQSVVVLALGDPEADDPRLQPQLVVFDETGRSVPVRV
ncbi:MAG: DUF6519 domain-containing protein [Bacteroidota bacterium]